MRRALMKYITEGKAKIECPEDNAVFYNPVQVMNRDLSIAAIRTFTEQFYCNPNESSKKRSLPRPDSVRILEGLSATGLRAIRYAKEIPLVGQIVANDLDAKAVEAIAHNIRSNDLSLEKVKPSQGDACAVMYAHRNSDQFDVIDLDPYGSAAPFMDAAVQAVKPGGLLAITCTDLRILATQMHCDTCFQKYGGMPLRSHYSHEMALRLVLHALETSAARYGRHIVPLMSCSIDFYVRLFVRIDVAPVPAKLSASLRGIVYHCTGCQSFETQPLGKVVSKSPNSLKYTPAHGPVVNQYCGYCNSPQIIGGPLWIGPLHNTEFVNSVRDHLRVDSASTLYASHARMLGLTTLIGEECNALFYWSLPVLSRSVQCNTISLLKMRSALLNAGFNVSSSHADDSGMKTDAPSSFIWDIMRHWVKDQRTERSSKLSDLAQRLLSVQPSGKVNFDLHPLANPPSRQQRLTRYPENPEPNWGPKARAGDSKKRKIET